MKRYYPGYSGARTRLWLLAAPAMLFFVLLFFSSAVPALAFTDVQTDNPYHTAIQDLSRRGIISGYTDGRFGPDDTVLRAQFAKMVSLSLGLEPLSDSECPFTDVDPGWPYPRGYVAAAAHYGITQGVGNNRFDPYAGITRAQVVTMIVRALETLRPRSVTAPPTWYVPTWGPSFSPAHGENARTAEFNGLLGNVPRFAADPWGRMTRAEVSQVLYNADVLAQPNRYTGSGDDVVAVRKAGGPALVRVSGNDQARYFGATAYGRDNKYLDLLVNTTDRFSGIRPLDFDPGSETIHIEVKATGSWAIEILPLRTARVLVTPGSIGGSGDEVIFVTGEPRTLSVRGNMRGRYFGIWAYGGRYPDLLVNTTSPYTGRVLIGGNRYLDISAEGGWTITAEP